MTTVALLVICGWILVAFLAGTVIGSAIHDADEHEQPMPVEDYPPTEVWL